MRQNPKIWDYCYFTTKTNLKAFKHFLKLITNSKKVVDIGCGTKPFKNLFSGKKYIGIDFNPVDEEVIVHDLNDKLPLADNFADAIILSEVLEHHPEPYSLLKEVDRIASKGAIIFISTPFALPVHGAPYDFYRYTNYFYENIEKKIKWRLIYFNSSNSIFSTPLQLINQITLGIPLPAFVLSPIWTLLNLLSILLDFLTNLIFVKKSFKLKYAFPMGYCAIYNTDESSHAERNTE